MDETVDLNLSDEDLNVIDESEPTTIEANSASISVSQRRTPKKKAIRRRYRCWKSFIIVGSKLPDGRTEVICIHCKDHYLINLRKNGTNTLLRHMSSCSKVRGTPGSSAKKIDMLIFRELVAMAIIEHNLSYSFVEYRRVKEALFYVNPNIKFWSRNTAATDVLKIFEKEKKVLRKALSKIPNRVCLTTDLWRAITVEGYLCLTAHYIDLEWNLNTKILSFCAFPPPHTGVAIAMRLIELIKDWGLEKKVFSITVDNASANDTMQGIVKSNLKKDLVCNGDFFHIRCSAHILNLIVQDGLTMIKDALEKIRESVKFVSASESREQLFERCLKRVGINDKAGLVLDVTTRWNSTYLMLFRALIYKKAFRDLAEVENSYKSLPSRVEWKRAKRICEFLEPFAEMTNLISDSSYPTVKIYFNEVWKIERWLRVHEFSDDNVLLKWL